MKFKSVLVLTLCSVLLTSNLAYANLEQYRRETIESQKLLNDVMRRVNAERARQQAINENNSLNNVVNNVNSNIVNMSGVIYNPSMDQNRSKRVETARLALTYQGLPYLWGGTGPRSFDCSGFVQDVYKRMGYSIPRVSIDQGRHGELVRKGELRIGDLVFFDTRNSSHVPKDSNGRLIPTRITHVGMYIGGGKMVHASSNNSRILVASLDEPYFTTRFMHGRRIIK